MLTQTIDIIDYVTGIGNGVQSLLRRNDVTPWKRRTSGAPLSSQPYIQLEDGCFASSEYLQAGKYTGLDIAS